MKNKISSISRDVARRVCTNLIFIQLFLLSSCSDFLEPDTDSTMTEEQVFRNAYYFSGPLISAYNALDNTFNIAMDNLTDNSVNRELSGSQYLCGVGGLSPDLNYLNNWNVSYEQIRSLNQFLSKMVLNNDPKAPLRTPVRFFVNDPERDLEEFNRLFGEAHFLRALYLSDLLKNFAGVTKEGDTLGVPLIGNRVLQVTEKEKLNIPRAAYRECVKAIVNDCDTAIKYLKAVEYKGTHSVWGAQMNGRASGIAARALKARVLLYAASPAFNKDYNTSTGKWEAAALAAAAAINSVEGKLRDLVSGTGGTEDAYYFTQLQNRDWNDNGRDLFFRAAVQTGNRAYENNNYPPSMYGSALNNPSQNFVDAFPDKDGYPIDESLVYDPANPYENRDPRFALWVGYNGSQMGGYHTIATYQGGIDAYNPLRKTSRTGYYLRKLLRSKTISLVPGAAGTNNTNRTRIILGKPELYLNYAEAANEAYGVNGKPPIADSFSAKDVLLLILKKYGCGTKYLNDVIGDDQNKFREYVRNCRRLDLSFEGHYYYDLRRWIPDGNPESLNVDVFGAMKITRVQDGTDGSGNPVYKYVYEGDPQLVEKRYFKSSYQPIPYVELYNATAVKQNKGW